MDNDRKLNRNQCVSPKSNKSKTWMVGDIQVTVLNRESAGLDSTEPWFASCDTHNQMVGCSTKKQAIHNARNRDWCDQCKK